MSRTASRLMAFALVGLPLAARAQLPLSPEQAYCARLSEMYIRYLGDPDGSRHMGAKTPDVTGGVAVAKCRAGNTVDAIPVLERLLTGAGFTLPPRS
jgi:hypothetical protein